jgi:hypothetical protein
MSGFSELNPQMKNVTSQFLTLGDIAELCASTKKLNDECYKEGIYKYLMNTPRIYKLTLRQLYRASGDKRWKVPLAIFGNIPFSSLASNVFSGFKHLAEGKDQKKSLNYFVKNIMSSFPTEKGHTDFKHFLETEGASLPEKQKKYLMWKANEKVPDFSLVSLDEWYEFYNLMKEIWRNKLNKFSTESENRIFQENLSEQEDDTKGEAYLAKLRSDLQRRHQAARVFQEKAGTQFAYDPKIAQIIGRLIG